MREPASMTIDLAKIRQNTASLVSRLHGVQLVGVTKGLCGSVEFARALIDGGCFALADSRLANLEGLRAAALGVPLWLIRSPAPSQADETIALADVSVNTELVTIAALADAASKRGVVHDVLLMMELGDIREGVLPDELPAFLREVQRMAGVRVHGLAGNFVCLGGALPTPEKLSLLVELRDETAAYLGYPLIVSGANSSALTLGLDDEIPQGVDNLRVGESILGGRDELRRDPIEGLHQDAIVIRALVIESRWKSFEASAPLAEQSPFGRPLSAARTTGLRVIVAMGQQDVAPFGLLPREPGITVLGGSSDHVVLDATEAEVAPQVGDWLSFIPSYEATVRAYTSPYLAKTYI